MVKRFTALVPTDILYALGWHNPATYAEVFDYLFEKGVLISICRYYDMADEMYEDGFEWEIDAKGYFGYGDTWVECANTAILKAIELI